jgi:ATP-dependent exoDNAse (exonuclease V) alpha subunit
MQWRQVQEDLRKVETRVSNEMQAKARLKMSTIGSSHKLFDISTKDQNNEDDDLAAELDFLSLNEEDLDDAKEETIVIFDEAGCIPSFELLGLSRLGYEVEAILVVGDKHQLPPYNPDNNGKPRYDRSKGWQRQKPQSKKLSSILDVSAVTVIKVTIQYRVPRDIADILNARIYNRNYRPSSDRGIPNKGLTFQLIPYSQDPRIKYVNPNEVQKMLELLREKVAASRSGNVSVVVLTPVGSQNEAILLCMYSTGDLIYFPLDFLLIV